MVRQLGATYYHIDEAEKAAAEADIVIECTGHVQMLLEAGPQHVRHRITCLTGVSAAGEASSIDAGLLNRNMVLQNSVIFGSVNANRHHYELAAEALAQAEPDMLAGLVTRQVPIASWADAYTRQPDDIKTILSFPGHDTSRPRSSMSPCAAPVCCYSDHPNRVMSAGVSALQSL